MYFSQKLHILSSGFFSHQDPQSITLKYPLLMLKSISSLIERLPNPQPHVQSHLNEFQTLGFAYPETQISIPLGSHFTLKTHPQS
jgi:hypothetical protein